MAAIPNAPFAVTYCACRRDTIAHALDGVAFLVPERERRQILGTIFSIGDCIQPAAAAADRIVAYLQGA